jgi:hypothetical protein
MICFPKIKETRSEKMIAMEARKLMNWNKLAPGSWNSCSKYSNR